MKEITSTEVKLVQFDRKTCKNVDYNKELDEGVFLRESTTVYLENIKFSVELKPEHNKIFAMIDLNTDIFEDKEKSDREAYIGMLKKNTIDKTFEHILSVYPLTQDDKDHYEDYLKFVGESIYIKCKNFWDNLDEDTKNDIREKNKVKVQTEEICLNDVLKSDK